jgi:hypothetical protein
VPLNEGERALLDRACTAVPPPAKPPAIGTDSDYPDFITNLLLTVLDLRLKNQIVNKAMQFYWHSHWDEIRTFDDLKRMLAVFPDDAEGNRAAAKYLWGYLYGDRLRWLRGLVDWADKNDLVDQGHLKEWAYASDYDRDFAGQINGLGPAAYCWLLMRLGVDTVKPDSWLHTFLRRAVGRDLEDMDLVAEVRSSAHRVGRQAREVDAGIWENERGAPGTI